jgi:hypothetical protein
MVQSQFSLIVETVHHFAIVLGIEDPIYGEWTESLALYTLSYELGEERANLHNKKSANNLF